MSLLTGCEMLAFSFLKKGPLEDGVESSVQLLCFGELLTCSPRWGNSQANLGRRGLWRGTVTDHGAGELFMHFSKPAGSHTDLGEGHPHYLTSQSPRCSHGGGVISACLELWPLDSSSWRN